MRAAIRGQRAAGVGPLAATDVLPAARQIESLAPRRASRDIVRRIAASTFRIVKPVIRPLMWRTRDYLSSAQLDALQRIEEANADMRVRVERLEIAMLNYSERSRVSTEDVATALDALALAVTELNGDLRRKGAQ
jgi:hypothetical protein